ncbi:Cell wall assembly regulator SMI1 [Saccharopolyspora kobensis]|uniref:Cell wall assembly regulator SMI1 n=1 Tax=Saccharopolyspora kobensis TaxID=146035 RepID=A0A1H5WKR7_9PSEU|nr:SMI1/KNR4 family protein [Saccharopolyspora kobensis]SEF99943.1 Cell wall assembly regulator SMI1 [Saccharopolyspora kobensis]SFD76629.1 Cell wall assembly regulator SMI1 [Saccharopolyspora kobensis]
MPEAEITALLQHLARSMVKQAPKGWQQTSISAHAHEHGVGGRGVINVLANGRSRPGGMRTPEYLKQIVELDDTGTGELAVELMVHPDGRYEAVTSRTIAPRPGGEPGHLYVLRPGVRPPDSGDLHAGPADPTEAGDPAQAVRLLWAYLRKRAEIFGWEAGRLERFSDVLPAPRDAEEIAGLERQLGARLPEDLRALYAVADGDGGDTGSRLFDRHPWLDLGQVVAVHHADRWWASKSTWRHHSLGPERAERPSDGRVRSSADRPGWIVFAESIGGDFLAVDMDPAEHGRPGQVIRVGLHHDEPVHVADSVTELLHLQLTALQQGDYRYDAATEQLWIHSEPPRRHNPSTTDAPDGDGAPVHHVQVTCDAELVSLTGHPTLTAVTARSADPLSLAPLRNCPRLYGLDLSRAEVDDLEVVAGMPGLLWLSMRPQQWHELLDRAGRPPGLAAAVLTGTPSPAALAAWAASLDGDEDIRYYTGRLPENAVSQ